MKRAILALSLVGLLASCGGSGSDCEENGTNQQQEQQQSQDQQQEQGQGEERVKKYQIEEIGKTFWYDSEYNFFGNWEFSNTLEKFVLKPILFTRWDLDTLFTNKECEGEFEVINTVRVAIDIDVPETFGIFDKLEKENKNRSFYIKEHGELCYAHETIEVFHYFEKEGCVPVMSDWWISYFGYYTETCLDEKDLASKEL